MKLRFGPLPIPSPVFSPPEGDGAAAEKPAAGATGGEGDKTGAKEGAATGGAGKTALEAGADGDGVETKVVAPADWPEDWRTRAAKSANVKGADKIADRFSDPGGLLKSYVELQAKLKSGKPNEDAVMPDQTKDPDGAKAWRAERGIPDEPTGYTVPDALQKVLTDEDKPVVSAFMEKAHGKHWTPKQVAEGLELYYEFEQQQFEARGALDKGWKEETQTELRQEWGGEFTANSKLAKSIAEGVTPELPWFNARLEAPGHPMHGRKLGDIPAFVKALADRGREYFGDVAFAGAEASKTTLNRLDELRKIMADEPERWRSKTEGAKLRLEYDKLVDARDRAGPARGSDRQSA
jgi:hypothetical protein